MTAGGPMRPAGAASTGAGTVLSVVLIDDDHEFRSVIGNYLAMNGLEVWSASGPEDFRDWSPDWSRSVIVLDLQLGGMDGMDVMRMLREATDAPIILMTGHRITEMDRVIGLELGADDYLLKPFGPRELLARIRVLARRHEELCSARAEQGARSETDGGKGGVDRRIYKFGGWELDRRLRILKDPSGRVVKLTKGDFALLVAFLDMPGRPLSREYLLNATRMHEDVFDRSVDVQILRLRRRLDRGGGGYGRSGREIIRTDRGAGYVFTLDVVS
ncbi:response regulator [Acidomonas methanolica]|uniref:Two component transcriptional regulator n=1 Tax=Acidomonas methanolica NBRC 104435 TaxID=1231351 RepID=A0A023D8M4_ACIMT|nr:response regulator [Acidomonas methanolica]MCQ9154990.1 response regulator [Acidomonas methanolica]TCS31188.1 DNA-binding response OmpR family regulator [Acidomonas methanolica]GAJ30459.1 two component transcriptional regulator [Acidomonas methanolica NBRC 104435]GBQ49768.1 two component response regulator [Acidomonas methanolica]GEK98564.1 DNA-binding response regulator [Acidomonas methanolica NBRC 104435]